VLESLRDQDSIKGIAVQRRETGKVRENVLVDAQACNLMRHALPR
jgi:hypothetical protein